jgi:hypothetical protein
MAREQQKLRQVDISKGRIKKSANTDCNEDFNQFSPVHEGRCRTLGYGLGETWFEIQDFKLEKIFLDKRFWWDVLQHVLLPLVLISKSSLLLHNLAALRADTSSQKLASIWLRKLLGFSAAWFAFVSTMVVWKLSGQDVSNVGDHLLRNISMV